MLTENRVFNHLRNLRLAEKLWIQGLILATVLTIIQSELDTSWQSSYIPPIRFSLFVALMYFVQPILIGVLTYLS
jgi:hypothetical protein